MAASFTWYSFLKCWPINSEFYCTVLSDLNAHLQGEGGLLVLITKGALVLQDDAKIKLRTVLHALCQISAVKHCRIPLIVQT